MQVQVQIVGLTLVLDVVWSAYVLTKCYLVPFSGSHVCRPSCISKNASAALGQTCDLIKQAAGPHSCVCVSEVQCIHVYTQN